MNTELAKSQETGEAVSREATRGGRFYRPNVDILENEEELILRADMPGTEADKVSLDYDNGTLTLHAVVKDRQPRDMPYVLQEYGVADFHREFQVNEDIDTERINADYKNGVLTVHLPKSEAVKPKRIEVKAS